MLKYLDLSAWDAELRAGLDYNGTRSFEGYLERLARFFVLRDTGPTFQDLPKDMKARKLEYLCGQHCLEREAVTDIGSAVKEYMRVWGAIWEGDLNRIKRVHGCVKNQLSNLRKNRKERLEHLNTEMELFGQGGPDELAIPVEYTPMPEERITVNLLPQANGQLELLGI